jgi:hypothetical protein
VGERGDAFGLMPDGDVGDDDGVVNGKIVDAGGVGNPSDPIRVSWE